MVMTTSRRSFIATTLAAACSKLTAQEAGEPVIDIHQHMNYHLRSDEHLLLHQKAMGVTKSIILPGGTYVNQPSTHNGKSNGLAAKCVGTAWARDFAQLHPDAYLWACNEVTDLASAPAELEHWLKQGACMIAEQKFMVECDSTASQKLYELAAAYNVPILLHFQHQTYNLGYDRFHTMLAKHPKTNFIGHAQAFWGNIDKNHDPKVNYPKGKVTPGGLTDRYQVVVWDMRGHGDSDYPTDPGRYSEALTVGEHRHLAVRRRAGRGDAGLEPPRTGRRQRRPRHVVPSPLPRRRVAPPRDGQPVGLGGPGARARPRVHRAGGARGLDGPRGARP